MTIEQLTTMPSLPQIGALAWGPDLNDCLTWLYEQVGGNATAIEVNRDQIEDLEAQVSALIAQVTALENAPHWVYNSYSWQYSNAAPPPTGSQVRFDNANLTLATAAVFRLIDNDGADRTPVFQSLAAGSKLRINDWNSAANIHRFNVTGPASIAASDVTVPVQWVSGSGTIPNAKANVAFLVQIDL